MKIFEPIEKDYSTNGLGLIQPLKCIETKKKSLNGWSIDVDISVKYNDFIKQDYIAVIETKEKGSQPFRISNISITNNIISFSANHVVFDAERYVLDDVRPTNLIGYEFLSYINSRVDSKSPFTVDSNVSDLKTKYFIRKDFLTALEETEELFNGVYDIDGFNIDLKTTVSSLSDETLIYGKNIQGMKKYEDWSEVCTKVLPVGPDGVLLPEEYISADIQYELPFTKVVSFDIPTSSEDNSARTQDEILSDLRTLAERYLEINKYPKINYTISSDINQELKIGSIIPVKHPLVTIDTEVQEYKYDCIAKRVKSIVYGNYQRDVKKEFGNINSKIDNVDKKTDNILTKSKNAINYLMNVAGKNGSIVFRKDDKGVIYEILAMDTKDIETAKNILRLNNQGLAGGTNGINGEFNVAVMSNGTIIADMITTGTLQGIEIICEKGKIGGWSIEGDVMTYKIKKKNIYNYTTSDTERIKYIISNGLTPTQEEMEKYDMDFSGYISSVDYTVIKNIISGIYGEQDKVVFDYNFSFSPADPTKILRMQMYINGGKFRDKSLNITSLDFERIQGMSGDIGDLKMRVTALENK